MPRYSSFPTLYDEALQLNISKLKAWGYLEPGQFKSGTLTWSNTNWVGIKEDTGSISIVVNTNTDRPYLQLNYKYGEEPRKYKVRLVSIPSNLGCGLVWYFLCPETFKRCRKLYLVDGFFLHRDAFTGCMYESQTKSKKWRFIESAYGCYFDCDNNYRELYKKHFKKTYAGKPTKKYLKLKKAIDAYERISHIDIQRLLMYVP